MSTCMGNHRELMASVGVGSLAAFYLIEIYKVKCLPLSDKIQELIVMGNIQDASIGFWESMIFFVGLIATLTAPIFISIEKKKRWNILGIIVVIFMNISGGIVGVVKGEMFPFLIFIIWVSSIYVI